MFQESTAISIKHSNIFNPFSPTGLRVIFPSLEKSVVVQVVTIWVVMGVATVSVLSGVGAGIRRISEVCFGVGMFLLLIIFMLDDSWSVTLVGTYSKNKYTFTTDILIFIIICSIEYFSLCHEKIKYLYRLYSL